MPEQTVNYKVKALDLLPALNKEINAAQNTVELWIELEMALAKAYQMDDNLFIDKLFKYMQWCFDHLEELPKGKEDDMYRSIIVTVIENLPTTKKAWPDIPKYFSQKTFKELKYAFCYHISENDYEEILKLYKTSDKNHPIL
jgi:hypothetical protein